MTAYFKSTDVKDEILKDHISTDIITESTSEVNALAQSMGVDPADIPSSTPYEVKMLAIAYACYRAALYAAGGAITNVMSGNTQQDDVFTKKAHMYLKEFNERKIRMTPEVMTGFADQKEERVPVIQLYRS